VVDNLRELWLILASWDALSCWIPDTMTAFFSTLQIQTSYYCSGNFFLTTDIFPEEVRPSLAKARPFPLLQCDLAGPPPAFKVITSNSCKLLVVRHGLREMLMIHPDSVAFRIEVVRFFALQVYPAP